MEFVPMCTIFYPFFVECVYLKAYICTLQGAPAAKPPAKSPGKPVDAPAPAPAASKGGGHKCEEKPPSPTKRTGSATKPGSASGRPGSGSRPASASSKSGTLNLAQL